MKKISKFSGVVALAVLVAGSAAAEGDEEGQRGGRARTFLVLRIAEALELSEDKALRISKILSAAEDRRAAIRSERAALAPGLKQAITAADETALADLVAKARELDRQQVMVVNDSFDEVDQVLTVIERGKLALLMPEIRSQLGRGGRRGPGAPRRDPGRRMQVPNPDAGERKN